MVKYDGVSVRSPVVFFIYIILWFERENKMKRLCALLFTLVLSISMLFSCVSDGDAGNEDETAEKVDYGTATVYAPGDLVQIIAPTSSARTFANYLSFFLHPMLAESSGGGTTIGSIYSPNRKLEVIIGHHDDSRPASETAYRLLERMDRDSYFEMRYLVYASSGMIVVAYDENEYTNLSLLDVIDDQLIDLILNNEEYVALAEGVVISGTVDLIQEQEELDRAQLADEWAALEAVVGKEATEAFRLLYTMYDDKMVEWAANLYDPGVGGFYTCTSGRDGAEFGPDVECTVQILRFFASSGMMNNLSSDWTDFLPERMQQQMIYFAKSLQHTNGYFYHPQWGKEAVDGKLSRRGRDLGWATALLSGLDSAPPYRAANGTAGDGVTADEYWDALVAAGEDLGPKPYPSTQSPTEKTILNKSATLTARLAQTSVAAVSKVILAADDNPDDPEIDASTEYLNSYTSYINYLLTKMAPGFDSNPYSMGNQMNATKSQIATKSDELEADGKYSYVAGDELTCSGASTALSQFKVNLDSDSSNDLSLSDIYLLFDGMNMKEMTITMLNEKINPEIGLWGQKSDKNPTGTEFLFTNGYFKTIGLYSEWGYAYPAEYIPQAADALMAGLLGDQPSTTNICEVYNIWSAIGYLKTNLKYLDKDEYAIDADGNVLTDGAGKPILLKDKVTEDVNKILNDNMAAAVVNTYNKVSGYKQPDGGFDHAYERNGGGYATQQGLNTGLRLNDQSNIDATCIGSTGLTRAMFEALGISYLKISLHTESDWMRALEIFISQDPVIKYSYDGETADVEYHDYEADVPAAKYLKFTSSITDNTFTQVHLDGNGVGLLNKVNDGAQAYFDWKPNYAPTVANTTVFETNIMFKDLVSSKDAIELRLYDGNSSSGTRLYTLYIYADKTNDGTVVSIAPKTEKTNRVEVGKVGEWFNLALVYCEETTVGDVTVPACFKVYINGSDTPVIVDRTFEDGSAVAATKIAFSRFLTMKAFRGKIYFDETRFANEYREITNDAPTHNIGSSGSDTGSGAPDTGCTIAAKDGVLTFDNATAFPVNFDNGYIVSNNSQSGWKGAVTFEKEGDNTFIRVNDSYQSVANELGGDEGQPIITINRPAYKGTANTFVFEARLRVSPLADGKSNMDSASFLDITFRNANEQRVYQTFFAGNSIGINSNSKNAASDVYETARWFTLRIEYNVVGADADSASWNVKAYVNENLVQESSEKPTSTNVKGFADSLSVNQIRILATRDFVGYLDIDDIKVYNK